MFGSRVVQGVGGVYALQDRCFGDMWPTQTVPSPHELGSWGDLMMRSVSLTLVATLFMGLTRACRSGVASKIDVGRLAAINHI